MSFLQQEVKLPKLSVPSLPARRRRPSSSEAPEPERRGGHGRPRRAAGRGKLVTGLEIGATQLIAAEATVEDGRIVARQVVRRPLPADLVRDGIVLDPDAVARELKELFSEHGLSRRVRVGLATPRTVLRVIEMPPVDEADVAFALQMQARDRIPMPLETAVLDHQTIGLVDTPEGQRLQVIVVATERAGVDVLLRAVRQAGLRPEGVDLSVFAAIRAVSGAEPPSGPTLYAQLGDLVNVAIAESGVCRFTRQAPQGLAHVLQRLADAQDVSSEEALSLMRSVQDGTATDPTEARRVGALLGEVAHELGSELRAAAEFYGNQSGATVTEGVVTGVLAPLRGFVPALAHASGLNLTCGEVQGTPAAGRSGVDASVAPVAVGLCVENVAR